METLGTKVRVGSKGEVVSIPTHVSYWGSTGPVVASRESTRFTWDADHSPPRGAVIPLWFSPDAIDKAIEHRCAGFQESYPVSQTPAGRLYRFLRLVPAQGRCRFLQARMSWRGVMLWSYSRERTSCILIARAVCITRD
jgi:hypothetical protein